VIEYGPRQPRTVEPLVPQQISFAQAEYEAKRKIERRDRFLGEMEWVVPWAALLAMLSPYYYPKAGQGRGRPQIGLERMLRMYFQSGTSDAVEGGGVRTISLGYLRLKALATGGRSVPPGDTPR
jgi:hypothetical protein